MEKNHIGISGFGVMHEVMNCSSPFSYVCLLHVVKGSPCGKSSPISCLRHFVILHITERFAREVNKCCSLHIA
jgi:hypothetical protein